MGFSMEQKGGQIYLCWLENRSAPFSHTLKHKIPGASGAEIKGGSFELFAVN